MWPGSPGPWVGGGGRRCCVGAVYTHSWASWGPSTLAPLREPRPSTLRPAAASLSLPPSRADFGLPHPHPSAFRPRGPGWKGTPSPPGKAGGSRACGRGPGCPAVCVGTAVTTGACVCVCVCVAAGIRLPGLHPGGAQPSLLFHSGPVRRCPRGPWEWPRVCPSCCVSHAWWLTWGEACLSTESPGPSQETDYRQPHPTPAPSLPTGQGQGQARPT